ncbi:MAG: type II toxin-antitoxin system VapC family toxin [Chloroflexota bacterium]
MALKYLVDTNVISELERAIPNVEVAAKFQAHQQEVALAAITWHELLYGYHRLPTSTRKTRIGQFLLHVVAPLLPILPFDALAADWLARERARLTGMGQPPAFADGQIAAIAAANDLILVTRNVQDFASFADLTIEDWFEE